MLSGIGEDSLRTLGRSSGCSPGGIGEELLRTLGCLPGGIGEELLGTLGRSPSGIVDEEQRRHRLSCEQRTGRLRREGGRVTASFGSAADLRAVADERAEYRLPAQLSERAARPRAATFGLAEQPVQRRTGADAQARAGTAFTVGTGGAACLPPFCRGLHPVTV